MENLPNIDIWFLVKIIYLFAFSLYLVFAVVMLRQVKLMTKALEEKINPILCTIAWGHLVLSILIILFSLLIL